jgi:hypothetical protein
MLALVLMKNLVFHGRSKHIDTKFHFIRECIEDVKIFAHFIRIEEQKADILMKALPVARLETMQYLLGACDLGPYQD